jgi:hypothetical protein
MTLWIKIWIRIPEYSGIIQLLDYLILDFTPLMTIYYCGIFQLKLTAASKM